MALRLPFDFEKEDSEHGEMLVSVADPLGSAPGASTFYLARRFDFTEGTYTFIVEADDAATLWIGTTQLDSRIVLSAVLGRAGENVLYIPQGQYRFDVVLENTPAYPTPCYFTLVILRDGQVVYASTKDGWLLDDTAISDADLPEIGDVRFKLPVWSILPNWQDGVTERLSWMTDVMSSETSAEQRRSVRRNARRSFEASFLRKGAQRSRMDAFFVGVGASQFMLPLWHEQVKMKDGIDMEASGVVLDHLSLREFRTGDLVFVSNGDPDDYDILQVGDVEATRFSWAFPPPRHWPVGTRIYPMRQARIATQQPRLTNFTDDLGAAQVMFDLVEPYSIQADGGSSVGGSPLFNFHIDRADPLDVEYVRKAFTLDNDSGVPNVIDHGKYSTTISQAKLCMSGRASVYRLRQFLQFARGRSQLFMCPTFTNDIQPLGDIDGDEVYIRSQGFRAAMAIPQPVRIQLAFQFYGGAPTLYRTITDAHTVYNELRAVGERLTLDSPLPPIKLADLKRISFVCETRFDNDLFEIHHTSTNSALVDVAVVLRQSVDKRVPK